LGPQAANCREFKGFGVTGVGMMSFRSKRNFSRVALAATMGMAIVIGCAASGAHAADDDEDDSLLDTKIVRGIMKGLGLRREEASIDYRERSPLVLPPANEAKQLPAPANDANARKTAAWPDDPDAKRVKQRKDAERSRKAYTEGVDDRPLLPNEVNGGVPRKKGSSEGVSGPTTDETSSPIAPSKLGSKNFFSNLNIWGGPKEESAPFTGEPPRASLTEPPAGYRTPSPAQPYGVGPAREAYKPVDRQEPVK
jgi:hypothetical protein